MNTKKILKKAALATVALGVLAGAGVYGYQYWTVDRFLESTDDAYLKADYTTVAPKVSGYIAEVLVDDNQKVKAGQVLARIDDHDFKTARAQAKAERESAKATIRNLAAQLVLQQSVIEQAKADIAAAEAALAFAQADYARYHHLRKTGFGSVQRDQQAEASLQEKRADVEHDRAVLAAAERQIDVIKTEQAKAETALARARAVKHQADLNVGYTVITAPIDGTVGARSLRVGQYVQAGTALMAVVPLENVFVVANFKETQLTDMRRGERVTVQVDSFPGAVVRGSVDSLSPASGLEFALLPPDNATGNFTKIVQRIPVKVVFDADNTLLGLLRPGMSVTATVDTKPVAIAARDAADQVASAR
ncbi:MAG: HlyD family secretion protein [Candidatus Eiseniibacteriota bacterium]